MLGVDIEPSGRVHLLLDGPDGEEAALVDRAPALGVSCGEVVVDGEHVQVLVFPRDQRCRDRAGERLALAREHLDDAPVVERQGALELDEEGLLARGTPGDLAGEGECSADQRVVLAAADEPVADLPDLFVECRLGEAADRRRELVAQPRLGHEPRGARAQVLGLHHGLGGQRVEALGDLRLAPPAADGLVQRVVFGQRLAHV